MKISLHVNGRDLPETANFYTGIFSLYDRQYLLIKQNPGEN
jgi:hypothetical protein